MTGVLNEATPTVIRRNLREVFPENKLPTAIQIANKIAHCRKQVNATRQVLATGDLRRLIAENSEIDIPDICHLFYTGKILENKIYTEKRQFFALKGLAPFTHTVKL